jgi:hypothetical protein
MIRAAGRLSIVFTATFVLLAPLGCSVTVTEEGGGGGAGAPAAGGQAAGGGSATACTFLTAAEIQQTRDAAVQDMNNGVSRADELAAVTAVCNRGDITVPQADCVACFTAIINEVYP